MIMNHPVGEYEYRNLDLNHPINNLQKTRLPSKEIFKNFLFIFVFLHWKKVIQINNLCN